MTRFARIAAAVVLSVTVLIAAAGWLYVTRPLGLPGSAVRDALALDELSKQAASPSLSICSSGERPRPCSRCSRAGRGQSD